jgi:hypothetical protein
VLLETTYPLPQTGDAWPAQLSQDGRFANARHSIPRPPIFPGALQCEGAAQLCTYEIMGVVV